MPSPAEPSFSAASDFTEASFRCTIDDSDVSEPENILHSRTQAKEHEIFLQALCGLEDLDESGDSGAIDIAQALKVERQLRRFLQRIEQGAAQVGRRSEIHVSFQIYDPRRTVPGTFLTLPPIR